MILLFYDYEHNYSAFDHAPHTQQSLSDNYYVYLSYNDFHASQLQGDILREIRDLANENCLHKQQHDLLHYYL